jgi:hypothetical protein
VDERSLERDCVVSVDQVGSDREDGMVKRT